MHTSILLYVYIGEDVYPEVSVRSKRCKAELLVQQMKLLMTLNLSHCNITNQGAEMIMIATILLETDALERLDLSNTMLNTANVVKICHSLKVLSSLKIFSLRLRVMRLILNIIFSGVIVILGY